MNRDLMMKAAVKFEGVWPDDGYGLIVAIPSDIVLGNEEKDGSVSYVSKGVTENTFLRSWSHCTRKQFEDFVESLFECAPADATHYSPEDKNNEQTWWKLVGDEMLCICEIGDIHTWERGHFDETIQLIPHPVKKAEPQAPWVPKVGEECEYSTNGHKWHVCEPLYIGNSCAFVKSDKASADGYREYSLPISHTDFRPLRTERELFIEQATKDYLDQVGSEAVNAKWFERIFGAMYDKGYRKTRD